MALFISLHDLPDGVRALLLDCHVPFLWCLQCEARTHLHEDIKPVFGKVEDILDFRKNIGSQLIQKGFLISLRSNLKSIHQFSIPFDNHWSADWNNRVHYGSIDAAHDKHFWVYQQPCRKNKFCSLWWSTSTLSGINFLLCWEREKKLWLVMFKYLIVWSNLAAH